MAGRFLFGPVASRRLGRSLGVDLIPPKTCPFDCIYCEVGRTTRATAERARFNDPAEILRQLDEFFASGGQADYITFSGSGEPTLSSDLGYLISESKKRYSVPVAVITNGALLSDPAVRADLAEADLVIPSLDAVREGPFKAVNRPVDGVKLAEIVEGLVAFGREFRGRVWLEVLVVAGVNDADEDVAALAEAISRIRPERVQLNTVVRPPAESYARPVAAKRLEAIAARLAKAAPTEIVAPASLRACAESSLPPREAVLETVVRRPCTAADLEAGLALSAPEVAAALEELIAEGKVKEVRFGAGVFYEGAGKP
jgi:wyosine [tRNA(Phe)-imidazoG37] synthetase (radical SAM superfamily)